MQITGNHKMARIVRHNDESVREGHIRNGGKEVKLFPTGLAPPHFLGPNPQGSQLESMIPLPSIQPESSLSVMPKNLENFPPRRSTLATPPCFHRPTNYRHATQQNEKTHFRQAPHPSSIKTWD
ncbi:hypothetical protein TNCV_3192161 [Trichonephila clavipes]|nr:hypothetical protein TNCV_3192161 [Trichonephila clavipes]